MAKNKTRTHAHKNTAPQTSVQPEVPQSHRAPVTKKQVICLIIAILVLGGMVLSPVLGMIASVA